MLHRAIYATEAATFGAPVGRRLARYVQGEVGPGGLGSGAFAGLSDLFARLYQHAAPDNGAARSGAERGHAPLAERSEALERVSKVLTEGCLASIRDWRSSADAGSGGQVASSGCSRSQSLRASRSATAGSCLQTTIASRCREGVSATSVQGRSLMAPDPKPGSRSVGHAPVGPEYHQAQLTP